MVEGVIQPLLGTPPCSSLPFLTLSSPLFISGPEGHDAIGCGLGSGAEVTGGISHCCSAVTPGVTIWGFWYLPPVVEWPSPQRGPECHRCLGANWEQSQAPALLWVGCSPSSPPPPDPSGSKQGLGFSLTPDKEVDTDSLPLM